MSGRRAKAARERRRCLFCDQPADSKEHLWPEWLNDVLPNYTETVYYQGGVSNGSIVSRGRPAHKRLRVVCQRCNGGWMSRLENAAKPILIPMLDGRKQTLDQAAQTTLAAWAFKTASVGECLNHATALIPRAQREHVRDKAEPPAAVAVYVAVTDARWPGDTHYSDKKLHVSPEVQAKLPAETVSADGYIGYVATIAIRHVALQVVGAFSTKTQLRHAAPIDQFVDRIWPHERVIEWPGTPTVDAGGLAALIDHFRGDAPPSTSPF